MEARCIQLQDLSSNLRSMEPKAILGKWQKSLQVSLPSRKGNATQSTWFYCWVQLSSAHLTVNHPRDLSPPGKAKKDICRDCEIETQRPICVHNITWLMQVTQLKLNMYSQKKVRLYLSPLIQCFSFP